MTVTVEADKPVAALSSVRDRFPLRRSAIRIPNWFWRRTSSGRTIMLTGRLLREGPLQCKIIFATQQLRPPSKSILTQVALCVTTFFEPRKKEAQERPDEP